MYKSAYYIQKYISSSLHEVLIIECWQSSAVRRCMVAVQMELIQLLVLTMTDVTQTVPAHTMAAVRMVCLQPLDPTSPDAHLRSQSTSQRLGVASQLTAAVKTV